MSVWIDRVENHPLHKQLSKLAALLTELTSKPDLAPEPRESLDRLEQVKTATERQLAAADPLLVTIVAMNGMSAHVKQMAAELQQYRSNGSVGHLTNANNHADSLLVALAQLLPVSVPHDLEVLRDTTTSYRKSVEQSLRHIETERTTAETSLRALKQQVEGTRLEIDTQKSRLDTAIADFQRQFSEAEARRSADFTSAEKSRTEATAELVKEWDESISTDHDTWTSRLTGLEASSKEALADVVAKGAASHGEVVADLQARATQALQEMESRLKHAQQLVYVIANTGMVGGYQKTALQERGSANRWRVLAVISMLGLVGFAIYAFVTTVAGSFTWGLFAGRAFVAICFGILAAYSARQADRHEEVERNARNIELALASINPYLEGMPEQMQQELKREIALKVFAPATDLERPRDAKVSGTAADLLRMALEALNEVVKK